MARVFVSHSSRDAAEARTVFAWLKARGFDQGFLDIDKHYGIPPGERWEQKLYEELEHAQAVILLLTKNGSIPNGALPSSPRRARAARRSSRWS